ncbi:MAG: response regulator, partial [Bacteroidetes bacterium]|nr:response regulator [Bacteroidota bacterium]
PEKTQSYDVLFNSTARKGIGKRITDSIRDRFDSFDHKIEARKVEKTIELIKASRKADNISLALNLFAFIFAFGTALFITKMIGKRIDRMVKLAERISYGDFNMEFTDRREDELSTLSSSLVVMAATLRDNFEKLEKINRELEESKKEIERTANIKEQFLTNMSHEIRTPLNAIIGFSGLLWDSELNEDQRQQLSIIKSSGKNLITIINDVLDFSRLNADKVRIEKRSFRLPRLINEVIELFSLMAKEKRIELTSFVDKGIPEYVSGDIVRLRQVLVNLVGNAVKFTNKGKVILDTRLNSVTSSYYDISFSITDTGIGIHKEDLPHIFDSFVQGSRDVTGRYGGSGLGLAIVKRLGDLMGGTIDVKSELHRGSTFTLAIPLEKPYEEGTGFETHTIKDSGFPVIEKIRVLLVEDNLFNQQLVAAILKSWNWNLTTAGNGRSAIKCLEDQEFDVVLMDVRLPDMDGYEIVRYIRKELPPDKSGVPVIAITAHSFASEEEKCRAAGMNDFLSKPFEKEKLYSKVVCLTGRTGSQEGHAVCPESPEGDLKYEKVVDLDYLKRIMNNDPDYIKVIIRDFISQAADSLADLKLMYRNFEWGLIKALAHKLKTSYMIMGIKQARDILCKIEEYHFHGLNDPVADEMIRQFVEIS